LLLLAEFYDEFETSELKDYFRDNLEFDNDQYATTINEYRNGLLIFDVMNKNIWMKAKNDTVGLRAYYEGVKENYLWNDRVDALLVTSSTEAPVIAARELLLDGKLNEEIKETLNTKDKINVILSEGVFEKGDRSLPENFDMVVGVSKVYSNKNGYEAVKVHKVIPKGIKPLEAVKGKVMSDYQKDLEAKWMDALRSKYKVQIHKKTLRSVKKELKP
jgi:peptidyl-prolyl cis-trans isomerase SurA